MKFAVATASLNQLDWLGRCVRSVADQRGDFSVEHLIQDGESVGIEDFRLRIADLQAANPYELKIVEAMDTGMYDALNKTFRRISGEVVSILNCDEQYLPGALERVADIFQKNPEIDIVVGDFLIVDPAGELLSFRKATPLRASMILTDHLYDFTCAMFFRRRLLERGSGFDTGYRAAADAAWVAELLRSGVKVAYVDRYLATFTLTGENVSLRADRAAEAARLRAITPRWARVAAPFLRQWRHVEKLLSGGYRSAPISYEIYVGNAETRTRFVCAKPEFRHPWN